ncbi:MAG: hypothetical protein M0P58_13685, partial [Bacteroidales bacterium]|nr:hypothetical protein [Bacteroidales bacterium]
MRLKNLRFFKILMIAMIFLWGNFFVYAQQKAPSGYSILYSTDFESFIAGQQIACQDTAYWTTKTFSPCGSEDAYVSTEYAHSGANS